MVKDGSSNPEKPTGSPESLPAFIAKKKNEIKELWNPKNPNESGKNAVLSSIVDVSESRNFSSQDVTDMIYGAGKVDLENFLDSLA